MSTYVARLTYYISQKVQQAEILAGRDGSQQRFIEVEVPMEEYLQWPGVKVNLQGQVDNDLFIRLNKTRIDTKYMFNPEGKLLRDSILTKEEALARLRNNAEILKQTMAMSPLP